jgi:hypothetical protein
MSDERTLPELLVEAELVRRVCRQMCVDDGVEPDEVWVEAYGREFKNYEHHTANVTAVLRALKAIAS